MCQVKNQVKQILFVFSSTAPAIEKVNDHICDIATGVFTATKGDPVIYSLQVMVEKIQSQTGMCVKI